MALAMRLRSERAVVTYALAITGLALLVTHLALHVGIGHAEHMRHWKIASVICIVLGLALGYFGGKMNARTTRMADELAYLTRHDPLTGCYSRRHFFRRATQPRLYPAAVILIDLDRFKSVNDQFGHAAGDAALCHLVRVMQGCLGPHDTLARLGGEEFVVFLPGADGASAARVAEALLSALRAAPLEVQGEKLVLTASFGVCQVEGPDGIDLAVQRADLAMYRAKTNGRAQVCRYADIAGPANENEEPEPAAQPDQKSRPRVRQNLRGRAL